MDLVVDANVLFAALVGRDKTQELFFTDKINLIAPLKLIEEFEKNKEQIAKWGKVNISELMSAFNILKERIKLFSTNNIPQEIRSKAEKLSPHEKDVPYFALALHLGAAIWSREKAFEKQDEIKIYSTKELADMFLINNSEEQ